MNNDEDLGLIHQYSGLTFIRIRINKSVRKEHECLTCKSVIPIGSPSAYHSGRDPQVGFYYFHQCMTCHDG